MNQNIKNSKYITVSEASVFLGIAKGTLRNWVWRSKFEVDPIPFTKFTSRCLRFPLDKLEVWAERRNGFKDPLAGLKV